MYLPLSRYLTATSHSGVPGSSPAVFAALSFGGESGVPIGTGLRGLCPEVVERSQEAPRVVLYAAGRHAAPLLRERSQCVRFRCTPPAARRNRLLLEGFLEGGKVGLPRAK